MNASSAYLDTYSENKILYKKALINAIETFEYSNNPDDELYNVSNASQGETKKVLTVCSAGLLRSATLQNMLIKEYGYNVRNCGTVESYALIPISEALVKWADEIVFVNSETWLSCL